MRLEPKNFLDFTTHHLCLLLLGREVPAQGKSKLAGGTYGSQLGPSYMSHCQEEVGHLSFLTKDNPDPELLFTTIKGKGSNTTLQILSVKGGGYPPNP